MGSEQVTPDAARRLIQFIERERRYLDDRANNLFAYSWARGWRYACYLVVTLARYHDASENWKAAQARFADLMKGFVGGTLTAEMHAAMGQIQASEVFLHLEIESFYVFAKIVLDCLARSIQQTFGQHPGLALLRHSQILKGFESYAIGRGLSAPSQELLVLARDLQVHVSDFRDKFVVHLDDPRRTFGTSWDAGGHAFVHAANMLYPRKTDPRDMDFGRGRSPVELGSLLDRYIDLLLSYVASNMSLARGYVGTSETSAGAADEVHVPDRPAESDPPYSDSEAENLRIHLDYADHVLQLHYSPRSVKLGEPSERVLNIPPEQIPSAVLAECHFLREELRKQLLKSNPKGPVPPDVFLNGFLTVVVQDRARTLPVARLYVYEHTSPREYPRETELRLDPADWTTEQRNSWLRLVAEVMDIVGAHSQHRMKGLRNSRPH